MQLDNDLQWKSHISHLFKSGSFLLKSFSLLKRFSKLIQNLKIMHCSYIRPFLEYACPVWHPGSTKDQCSNVENIQKRAIKIILRTSYTKYDEILARLELSTLESRRHILTMNFENPPLLPNTRLNAHRDPNTQLDLRPQMLIMRYKTIFYPILFPILIIDLTFCFIAYPLTSVVSL